MELLYFYESIVRLATVSRAAQEYKNPFILDHYFE